MTHILSYRNPWTYSIEHCNSVWDCQFHFRWNHTVIIFMPLSSAHVWVARCWTLMIDFPRKSSLTTCIFDHLYILIILLLMCNLIGSRDTSIEFRVYRYVDQVNIWHCIVDEYCYTIIFTLYGGWILLYNNYIHTMVDEYCYTNVIQWILYSIFTLYGGWMLLKVWLWLMSGIGVTEIAEQARGLYLY